MYSLCSAVFMSYPCGTNWGMTDKRIEWLEGIATAIGVTIKYEPTGSRLRGYYHHRERIIVISPSLTTAHTVGTLAHELVHALHGHDGPQPRSIEMRVDRLAARMLVVSSEYEEAERLYGPHAGAIAKELDLPRWVVRAWQEQAKNSRFSDLVEPLQNLG